MTGMFEFLRNAFAIVGALWAVAFGWLVAMWVLSCRADRKRRSEMYLPPADDPAWDRLLADLLDQDRRDRP